MNFPSDSFAGLTTSLPLLGDPDVVSTDIITSRSATIKHYAFIHVLAPTALESTTISLSTIKGIR